MLQGIHDVFHVSLLRAFDDNGLYAANPPVEVEGEEEFEVASIKGHRDHCGERQFLVGFIGYDASEDMWLNEEQLEHASNLLDEYKQKAAL